MQIDVRVLSKSIKKTAREIYYELKQWLKSQDIKVKIYQITLHFDQKYTKTLCHQFWNTKIQQSSDNALHADPKILSKIEPKLLNENKQSLSLYLDYSQLIDDILVKPQEELFTVPQWQPFIRQQNANIDIETKQCFVYFFGVDADKLKKYDEERNQTITLFGQQYYLKQCNTSPKTINFNQSSFYVKGSEIQFGFFNQKFFTYWSTKQILKYYANGQVIIDNIKLSISNNQVMVYFDIIIDNSKRINFMIQFLLSKEDQSKNNTQNAGIIVDKQKEGNEIHFYVRVFGTPKCYMHENQGHDKFQHQKDLKYWRCQNFLHNDVITMIQGGVIKQYSYLRFSVDYQKTQNLKFLQFCQNIEKLGYLNRYAGDQHILLRRFSDFQSTNYIQQVRLCLNWMLVSAVLGRVSMLSIYVNFDNVFDQIKDLNPSILALQIKNLKQKKVEKKSKDIFTQEKFLDIITKNAAKNPDDKFDEIILADLTPTGLIPNYSIFEQMPLNNLEIIVSKSIKGKMQIKQNKIDQEIIKVRLRDEDFQQFKSSQINENNKNHILLASHFRQLLRNKFQILDRGYVFFAFDERALKKSEFYLINSIYFQSGYAYLFANLMKKYSENQNTVRCSQIQKIFNEHLHHLYSLTDLDQIQEKLFEERVENPQNTLNNDGPLLRIKYDTKIINRQLSVENRYNLRVLMPQGKVSQDIMNYINQFAFENTDYCCFIIRYKNFKGLITKMKNPTKTGKIVFYETMKEKYSPFAEQNNLFEQQGIRFEKKNLLEIQILGVPEFKPCLLQIYQILNIMILDRRTGGKGVENTFKKYYQQFKNAKVDDNPQTFYSNAQQYVNEKKEFHLPIKGGAYLMAVYDSRLDPDEVFIQIQTDQTNGLQIVKGKTVLIFKKNYLVDDGLQFFQVASKEKKDQLAKIYKNVIVFSAHMICSKFPFEKLHDKQKFIAIWDQNLIPNYQKPQFTFDAKEDFKQLKYKIDKNQSFTTSLSMQSQSQKDEEWLKCIQEQMIDYFCLYQQDNIFEDLKLIYTKLLLYANYYLSQGNFEKELPKLLNQIKVHNLIHLWYSNCQARKQNLKKDLIYWYKEVSKEILNSEQMIDKLFQK